jgi:hypothetical protein
MLEVMRIAFISRYPPNPGGTASQAAVLIHGLAVRGVEIDVFFIDDDVNNIFTEQPYLNHRNIRYVVIEGSYFKSKPPNIFYIDKIYLEILRMNRERSYDLIDSWYIWPYSIAACMASRALNIPFLIRHSGSDIGFWIKKEETASLMVDALISASKVVTFAPFLPSIKSFGVKKESLFLNKKESIDTEIFNPNVKKIEVLKNFSIPIVSFLSEPSSAKGFDNLIHCLKKVSGDYIFIFLGDAKSYHIKMLNDFNISYLSIPRVPFFDIPRVIASSSIVVCPESDFHVFRAPRIGREVMSTGRPLLISEDIALKWPYFLANKKGALAVSDFTNFSKSAKIISSILFNKEKQREISRRAHCFSQQLENFNDYICSSFNLYQKIISERR